MYIAIRLYIEPRRKFRFYKSSGVLWAYSDEVQTNTDDSEELPEPYCPKWWCLHPLDFDDPSMTFYCSSCGFHRQSIYDITECPSARYKFFQQIAADDIKHQEILSQRPFGWFVSKVICPLYRLIRRYIRHYTRLYK